jgi:peptidoglycan/xylan/chitin deacetylase (PgdA/CDA1 family)
MTVQEVPFEAPIDSMLPRHNETRAAPALVRMYRSASRGAAKHVNTKPFRLRNTRPLVSFTFDDVPDSAFSNGARVLDRHDTRGTFYVAPGICGLQDDHWRVISRNDVGALAASGHEIGAHTYSHVRIEPLSAQAMADEMRRCREAFADLCPNAAVTNFAYPFGGLSLPRKLQAQYEYATCRSIYAGINSGLVDLGVLTAVELYDRTQNDQAIATLLDDVERTNGWLIFYTHDVASDPSWIGCSPQFLARVVAAVKARGIATPSIAEALPLVGLRK